MATVPWQKGLLLASESTRPFKIENNLLQDRKESELMAIRQILPERRVQQEVPIIEHLGEAQ